MQALAQGDFLWLLGSLCQLNRIAFNAGLVLQRFPAPHSVEQLVEALQSFGFRTGAGKIAGAAFPCVASLKEGDAPKPVIVVRSDAKQLLYFEAGSQTPATCPLDGLERFEPQVVLVRYDKSEPLGEEDGAAPAIAPGAAGDQNRRMAKGFCG